MTRDGWASQGIGEAVRDLRLERRAGLRRGLSQKALAERMTRLGYPFSQVQVSQFETRARNRSVSVDELLAFAAALDDRFQGVRRRVALTGVLKGAQYRRAYPTPNRRFAWTPTWTPLRPHSMPVPTTC